MLLNNHLAPSLSNFEVFKASKNLVIWGNQIV